MADITALPPMTPADAAAIGFATFNACPHLPIDIPDGGFTLTAKTSHGRRITFWFGPSREGGPPGFIDIQYHDRGSTIPDARGNSAPTFDFLGICRCGALRPDTRQLAEPDKPSILVLLLDQTAGSTDVDEEATAKASPHPVENTRRPASTPQP